MSDLRQFLDLHSDSISCSSDTLIEPTEDHGPTDETHYRMNHPRRGVAVIINIEHFGNSPFGERRGSQNDVLSLRTSFRKLGFDVEVYCDLTKREVEQTLSELSQRDHSDCDCLVVAFMSHGLRGQLRASDEIFDMESIFEPFTGEGCPTMVNKPKLFFIQACQGHDKQSGVYTQPEVTECAGGFLGIDANKMITIPSRADMLFAISTIPGFVSWRSPVSGAWYIQALCRWLNCAGFTQDLLTVLTRVTREVAVNCTFKNPFTPHDPICKQLPFFGSSLLRTLQFSKKAKRCRSSRKGSDAEEDEESEEEEDVERVESGSSLGRTGEEDDDDDQGNENNLDENRMKDFPKFRRFRKPNKTFQIKSEVLARNFPLIPVYMNYFSNEGKGNTQSILVEQGVENENSNINGTVNTLEPKPSLMLMGGKRTNEERQQESSDDTSKRRKHN